MNSDKLENRIKPIDNQANQVNPNKGTDGTNIQYDKGHGNKGKQLNPNQNVLCPTCGNSIQKNSDISYRCDKCFTSF